MLLATWFDPAEKAHLNQNMARYRRQPLPLRGT
jgi:hypothetical protein